MEDAGPGSHPESPVHGLSDGLEVAAEGRDGVPRDGAGRVLAVIPQVEHDDIEVIEEERPERVVEVDREPVAVAQQQAGPIPVPIPPYRDRGLTSSRTSTIAAGGGGSE